MKLQPLSFTIPVLILAGILFSAMGYLEGGVPKAKERAIVWFAASTVGILLSLWLRRGGQVKR